MIYKKQLGTLLLLSLFKWRRLGLTMKKKRVFSLLLIFFMSLIVELFLKKNIPALAIFQASYNSSPS